MLSIEIIRDGRGIQLECDDAGIDALIKVLEKLRGTGGHIHLRSPSAGGHDLSDLSPYGEIAISELVISNGGD
jgi:hypothetical protein